MRNPNNLAAGPRAFRRAGGLASAAVFLSLAACTGDTLDNIQSDLANGEDVNINLSTNCLLYTSPSPRDQRGSRMPSSA